jgi:hypothetical protein
MLACSEDQRDWWKAATVQEFPMPNQDKQMAFGGVEAFHGGRRGYQVQVGAVPEWLLIPNIGADPNIGKHSQLFSPAGKAG